MIDKNNIIDTFGGKGPVILELGCGNRKRYPGSVGVDILDYPAVDLVGDVCDVLKSLPSSSVKCIYAYHVLEHIANLDELMSEAKRVLISAGIFDVITPHFSNSYYYSDPTHKRFFALYTFCYYADSTLFSRSVPQYTSKVGFEIRSVDLRFKSTPPFYFRHGLRRLFGMMFNSSRYLREFYEENLTAIVSCYEIHYVLVRKQRD